MQTLEFNTFSECLKKAKENENNVIYEDYDRRRKDKRYFVVDSKKFSYYGNHSKDKSRNIKIVATKYHCDSRFKDKYESYAKKSEIH